MCGAGECRNTNGGYNCVCPEGYRPIQGGRKCEGINFKFAFFSSFLIFYKQPDFAFFFKSWQVKTRLHFGIDEKIKLNHENLVQ